LLPYRLIIVKINELEIWGCYKGIDYNEAFSPVAGHISVGVLLAFVALFDLELEQLDVKIAFLHGELEEEI